LSLVILNVGGRCHDLGSVGHIEMVVTCQSGGGSKVEVVDVVQEVGVYMAFFYITRTYIK
jgi:hypothetical protein